MNNIRFENNRYFSGSSNSEHISKFVVEQNDKRPNNFNGFNSRFNHGRPSYNAGRINHAMRRKSVA